MSVEKMEAYKEYKKHRKEILRKQKRKEAITVTISVVVLALFIGLCGFLIYKDVRGNSPETSKPKTKKSDMLVDWNKYVPKEYSIGNNTKDSKKEDAETKTDSSAANTATDNTDASAATDSTSADASTDNTSAESSTTK